MASHDSEPTALEEPKSWPIYELLCAVAYVDSLQIKSGKLLVYLLEHSRPLGEDDVLQCDINSRRGTEIEQLRYVLAVRTQHQANTSSPLGCNLRLLETECGFSSVYFWLLDVRILEALTAASPKTIQGLARLISQNELLKYRAVQAEQAWSMVDWEYQEQVKRIKKRHWLCDLPLKRVCTQPSGRKTACSVCRQKRKRCDGSYTGCDIRVPAPTAAAQFTPPTSSMLGPVLYYDASVDTLPPYQLDQQFLIPDDGSLSQIGGI